MTATTAPAQANVQRALAAGKRRRRRNEALLAVLFVLPATVVTFLFGIWPVIFGFFISLHQWRARSHSFLGLDQYVRALGTAAYVLSFFLCLLFLYGGYRALKNARAAMAEGKGSFYPFLLPGLLMALGTLGAAAGFVSQTGDWFWAGLIMLAAGGAGLWWTGRQQNTSSTGQFGLWAWQLCALGLLALGLFLFTVSEILNDSALPFAIVHEMFPNLYIPPLGEQMLVGGLAVLALLGLVVIHRWQDRMPEDREYGWLPGVLRALTFVLVAAIILMVLYFIAAMNFDRVAATAVRDEQQIDAVLIDRLGYDSDEVANMRNTGRQAIEEIGQAITGMERDAYRQVYGSLNPDTIASALLNWPQIIAISVGCMLMFTAWRTWQRAAKSDTNIGTTTFIGLAILIAIGGWLLIGELPQAMAAGDAAYYNSLVITAAYAIGTVPVQLVLGIFLAYLLFYEINLGKSLYRMIYFLPYVAPTVATATVFWLIFSLRPTSLANQVLGLFGIPAQGWLSESTGVFQIIANLVAGPEVQLPSFLVGPSLALASIILYNIWVFAGYNAVIFLAGLGAIPGELYEAAKVDGAGRWAAFRKITLPLLSPTIFFLLVLSTIGTFRAFNHIYVLRRADARGTADTTSVHIFVQFWQFNQWGYAAAMSFVLFGIILVLTLVQNELSKERVFYG